MPKQIAVFNFERTITDNVIEHVFDDLSASAGVQVEREGLLPPTREQRLQLLGWLTNKRQVDIQPVMDITTENTDERLADWAKVVMEAESERDSELCLYSATVPQPILDAYAEGVRRSIPDANPTHVHGKPLKTDNEGRFTGETTSMLKMETVESLQEEGYELTVIAESFGGGFLPLPQAGRPIIANPDRSLILYPDLGIPILHWEQGSPDTRLRTPDEVYTTTYDLSEPIDRQLFLYHLGYT